MSPAERRREAVARLIAARHIATQEELLAALREDGFEATQATLSRDLARLGARRASAPGGGTRYELAE
ncbi:MAG TPA: arginine repressor, partial [Anaeromyxobacteraceae bacterium]